MLELSVTLDGGERHSFVVDRKPKGWRSWLMRRLPYGTSFVGAEFGIAEVEG